METNYIKFLYVVENGHWFSPMNWVWLKGRKARVISPVKFKDGTLGAWIRWNENGKVRRAVVPLGLLEPDDTFTDIQSTCWDDDE